MDKHKSVCLSEQVYCEYDAMGCEHRVAHRNLEVHNKDNVNEHLLLTRDVLNKSKQEFDATCQNLEK